MYTIKIVRIYIKHVFTLQIHKCLQQEKTEYGRHHYQELSSEILSNLNI